MKRHAVLLTCLMLLSYAFADNPAQNNETKINRTLQLVEEKNSKLDDITPKWSEFCPITYINAQEIPVSKFSKGKIARIVFFTVLFYPVGAFMFWNEKNKQNQEISFNRSIEYWNTRHLQFDNEVSLCKESQDKTACYFHIQDIEYKKTQDLNAWVAHQQDRAAYVQAAALRSQPQIVQVQQTAPTIQAPRNYNCSTYGNMTSCNGY